jgi:hypothetical protein
MANVNGSPGGGANHRVLTALVNGIAIGPDSPDARRAQAISKSNADPRVMLHVLDSLVPTSEAALREIAVPALVAIGDQDERSDAGQVAGRLNPRTLWPQLRHGGRGHPFLLLMGLAISDHAAH